MSVLKEKAQVILLPTENKSNLILNESLNILGDNNYFSKLAVKLNSYINYYHLYIVSDEEIKEGDWYLSQTYPSSKINKYLSQKPCKFTDEDKKIIEENNFQNITFKIIATTDASLNSKKLNENSYQLKYKTIYLPQPSQGFIEKYIKEYNKGNIITDILVEYNDCTQLCACQNENIECQYPLCKQKQLRVSKDNTITIHPVKDTWSREEVEQLLFKYAEEEHAWFSNKSEINSFNKWIEENL